MFHDINVIVFWWGQNHAAEKKTADCYLILLIAIVLDDTQTLEDEFLASAKKSMIPWPMYSRSTRSCCWSKVNWGGVFHRGFWVNCYFSSIPKWWACNFWGMQLVGWMGDAYFVIIIYCSYFLNQGLMYNLYIRNQKLVTLSAPKEQWFSIRGRKLWPQLSSTTPHINIQRKMYWWVHQGFRNSLVPGNHCPLIGLQTLFS